MPNYDDLDPTAQAMMTEQIAYAFRYWVAQDPETRQQYLPPAISLHPDDFEIDATAAPAFMAWLKLTGVAEVNRLSGWDRHSETKR